MKIKQNSYLDIDKLKIGDLLYTPELVKDGQKYKCDFNVFKIKEFYTNKDKKYDKYSAILSPLQIINADGTYKFDESDSAEVKGSIKNGFCTKETQKECLEAFKEEFVGMVEAIDALLNVGKKDFTL